MSFCQGGVPNIALKTPSDLRESLATAHTALEATDGEVTSLRDRLEEADHLIVG